NAGPGQGSLPPHEARSTKRYFYSFVHGPRIENRTRSICLVRSCASHILAVKSVSARLWHARIPPDLAQLRQRHTTGGGTKRPDCSEEHDLARPDFFSGTAPFVNTSRIDSGQ